MSGSLAPPTSNAGPIIPQRGFGQAFRAILPRMMPVAAPANTSEAWWIFTYVRLEATNARSRCLVPRTRSTTASTPSSKARRRARRSVSDCDRGKVDERIGGAQADRDAGTLGDVAAECGAVRAERAVLAQP